MLRWFVAKINLRKMVWPLGIYDHLTLIFPEIVWIFWLMGAGGRGSHGFSAKRQSQEVPRLLVWEYCPDVWVPKFIWGKCGGGAGWLAGLAQPTLHFPKPSCSSSTLGQFIGAKIYLSGNLFEVKFIWVDFYLSRINVRENWLAPNFPMLLLFHLGAWIYLSRKFKWQFIWAAIDLSITLDRSWFKRNLDTKTNTETKAGALPHCLKLILSSSARAIFW